MIKLNEEQKTRYFHRSFSFTDGLWFMKVEERYGFDTALEIDREVWSIVPKVQARMMKEFGGAGDGLETLREALETKHSIEDFRFSIEDHEDGTGFSVIISQCPWYNLMKKSGRELFAERVGNAVCTAEYPLWAAEFGDGIEIDMPVRLCRNESQCIIRFTHTNTQKEK